jgi:hypothetical protein
MMPTDQPNNAPDEIMPKEELTVGAVLSDTRDDETPGGGGLGGLAAAEGTPQRGTEGASPSNPASPAVAGDTASLKADDEARARSDAPEPQPDSQ